MPDPKGQGRFHYAGLGGSGMSALAQFQAMTGGEASGSDRAFDRGERAGLRSAARTPRHRRHARRTAAALAPTARHWSSRPRSRSRCRTSPRRARTRHPHRPPLRAARPFRRHPSLHRGDAARAASRPSTAMVFEILRGAGRDPSVITGGDLPCCRPKACPATLSPAARTCSSSRPTRATARWCAMRLRSASSSIFSATTRRWQRSRRCSPTLRARSREALVVGEDENLDGLRRRRAPLRLEHSAPIFAARMSSSVRLASSSASVALPSPCRCPGAHNVANALAAIAAAARLGVPLAEMVAPLAAFRGIGRRFQTVGKARGVEVIDDFAHNADKIAAAIRTAKLRAKRVLAIYQPHGYGPDALPAPGFRHHLRPRARPGRPAVDARSVLCRRHRYARLLRGRHRRARSPSTALEAEFAPSREWLVARIAEEAQAGDLVLVMGARDPSLTELARSILAAIESADAPPPAK